MVLMVSLRSLIFRTYASAPQHEWGPMFVVEATTGL
jgi:hypothetical protein